MKRWIHGGEQISFPMIDKIDVIAIVDDARTQGLYGLPVVASIQASEDYDGYSVEELMDLDDSTLRKINTFYALDNLLTAVNDYGFDYKLTTKQQTLLSDFYKKRENSIVDLTDSQINDLLKMIKECTHVTGPHYRMSQPEKNFEEVHGIEMVKSDYLGILHSLTKNDFLRAIKSSDTKRLGILLYEFKFDRGYKLKHDDYEIKNGLEIYIKLIPHYQEQYNIALVSFHDMLDEER